LFTGVSSEANDDTEQIRFNGDFRYRIELTNTDGDSLDARSRHRIRARFGFQANIAEEARFVFQLASGSDDLVSSNQTLSGAFSSKNIVLDLAYGEYEPIALDRRVTLIAGKSVLPFFRPGQTELLWDSDLRPEGISGFFDLVTGGADLRMLGGWYILQEREDSDNSNLLAGQLIATLDNLPFITTLSTGVGYFHFTELKHRTPLVPGDFAGNSFYPDTTDVVDPPGQPEIINRHLHEYREVELFFDAWLSGVNRPLLLMGDLVFNTDPDDNNTGWLVGLKWGQVSERSSWSVRYNYRRLEKDAVYGLFTDSNFRDGGTDGKGHELGLCVGIMKNVNVKLSYFNNHTSTDGGDQYQRWMFDVSSVFK
jgi:hypothetical protein